MGNIASITSPSSRSPFEGDWKAQRQAMAAQLRQVATDLERLDDPMPCLLDMAKQGLQRVIHGLISRRLDTFWATNTSLFMRSREARL